MTATIEAINSVQKRVQVAVAADLVDKAFDNAYRKLQREAHIQGFRPGKAPLNLIKKLYGNRVAGEVGENLINQNLFGALESNNIRPIASPVVETANTPESGKEFTFSAVVDIMPEVTISGLETLAASVEKYEVKQESMTRELEYMQRRQAKSKALTPDTAASVTANHLVTLSHTAALNGSAVPSMNVERLSVALGRKELFEGLEKALDGMRAGETKTATITLPNDYGDETLAGKSLEFSITLHEVQELVLPEINDDLAVDMGFKSIDELKSRIQKHLETRAHQMRRSKLEMVLLDAIREKNNFDVPPSMVDQVIDSMIEELGFRDKKSQHSAMHNQDLRKNFLPTAKKKAQNTLILWKLAQQEKIEISDDDVRTHIKGQLAQQTSDVGDSGDEGGTPANVDTSAIDRLFTQIGPRVRENLLFERAMDSIISKAKIVDLPATI